MGRWWGKESRKGYNLTNTFFITFDNIEKSVRFHSCSYNAFCCWGQILHVSRTLDRISSLSSVDVTKVGELLILGMCFPHSEQEVDNTKSIVLCE